MRALVISAIAGLLTACGGVPDPDRPECGR